MGRINNPRETQPKSEEAFPTGAYSAGFLAFISTVYVILNRDPLPAVLMVGACWTLGLLLLPLLRDGRWRIVLEYFAELRAHERAAAGRSMQAPEAKPPIEEVDLSDREREQFAKLMNDSGFDFNWPKG